MDNKEVRNSRVAKNQTLYKRISQSDIDNFDVNSNSSILSSDTNQVDIDKIKKILDNKYKDTNKRKTITIDNENETKVTEDNVDVTKEYDLNSVLSKAKSELNVTYEESRIKKPIDSHLDILKKLDMESEKVEEVVVEETEIESTLKDGLSVTDTDPKELLNLINTIVINENKIKEDNTSVALDLFEDLVADSKEDAVNFTESKKDDETKNDIVVEKIDLTSEISSDLFATKETKFNKKDFESLDDEDDDSTSALLIIFIVLVIFAFLVGMYVFFSTFWNV